MPLYEYIAKNKEGEKIKSQRSAKNSAELAQFLKQEGGFLISARTKEDSGKKKRFSLGLKRVSLAEKLMATRNLAVMISSGISLPKALDVLALQTKNKYFQKVLRGVKEQVLKGESLSVAFSRYPRVFPEVYCSMVKVGEKTGNMENVLGILADQLERSYQLRSKVRGAMIYPAVIIVVMIVVGIAMLVMVVPQLSETFQEMGIELPAMTQVVISLGTFVTEQWHLLILFFLALVLIFVALLRSKKGKQKFHSFLLRVPFISGLTKKINAAFCALTLGALIRGGVSIVEALDIASGVVGNIHFKKSLKKSGKEIQKGGKLSDTLALYPKLYSGLFVQMVKVGEETGETSQMMTRLADFYEEQVNNITKNLSSVIEPVLLLFVGAVVGFFAISMVQPIYSIMGGM